MTPLILAVKQQNKEMIRYLIKEVKVNVDIVAEKVYSNLKLKDQLLL